MPIDPNVLFKAQPIDVAGSLQKGAESQQAQLAASTAAQTAQQDQQDTAAFRDYMKVADHDMSTSKGMSSALKDLQGRVSPKAYMGLVKTRDSLQKGEDDHVETLSRMGADERKAYTDTVESVAKAFGPEEDADTGDVADPTGELDYRKSVIDRMSKLKTSSGKPQFNPEALSYLADMPMAEFNKVRNFSKHATELAKLAEIKARTKKEEAATELSAATAAALPAKTKAVTDVATAKVEESGAKAAAAGSKPVPGTENLYGPDGSVYANIPGKGIINLATQEPYTDDPASLKPVPSVKGAKVGAAPVDKAKQAADNIDFDKNPPSEVEIGMAREFMVGGRMPSLGQNSTLRPRIAALAAKIALDENIDTVGVRATAKAETANIANMTKQYGVIKAGEETVLKNMDLIKSIIDKVDVTGVPALERWIRAGKRSIAGDKDVTQLDALIVSTQADIGKVLSAATGAAGTPVAALKKAEQYLNGNLTKDQFDALYEIIPKEMTARTKSMEEQIQKSLSNISKLRKGTKVAPDEQKARDTDALGIQRGELVKARQQVRDLKAKGGDPAAIARAEGDVASLERELKAKGATLDAAAPPATAPAPKATNKEGEVSKSKSGKPIIFRGGKWEYQ